jgi:hypothetical protein
MSRKIRIFGRSVPIAAILLAVVVVSAAAWAIIHYAFTGRAVAQATTASTGAQLLVGDPVCSAVGTGIVASCGRYGAEGGFDMSITGISENAASGGPVTIGTVTQSVENLGAVRVCATWTHGVIPAGVSVSQVSACIPAHTIGGIVATFNYSDILPGQEVDTGPMNWDYVETP